MLILVGGLGALGLQDVFMKALTEYYSSFELLALRTCFSVLAFRFALLALRQPAPLATRRIGTQLLRGTSLLIALACFYTALSVMPFLDVVAIFFTAPIIATALAALVLKERVSLAHWIAIAVGFSGALLMVRPSSGVMQTASLICLTAALFYGISLILSRRLGNTEPAATTAYYSLLCYLVWSSLAVVVIELVFDPGTLAGKLPLLKPWAAPTFAHLGFLAISGVMVAVGFFCMAHAYKLAAVTVLAPFEYTGIIWAGVLSYVAWNEVPSPVTWIGALLIVASGLFVARRAVPSRVRET